MNNYQKGTLNFTLNSLSFTAFLMILLLLSCKKDELFRFNKIQLGTVINITLAGESGEKASEIAEGVFGEIDSIERTMSPYWKESDIFRINDPVSEKPVPISGETFALIKKSIEISSETNGAFDITFASISHLWDFNKEHFSPPGKKIIEKYLNLVNYRFILLNFNEKSVLLKNGAKIGLGGIAKGYAIHRGIDYLTNRGVRAAIVEAGGDLQVIGDRFGRAWKVGLRHPRKNNLLLAIELCGMESIATSGDYERFALYRGIRYHHIMDPGTGFPARTLASVSVISKDPVLSDAYATALFVMGMGKAMKFIKSRGNIHGIIIDLDMNIYASQELKRRISPIVPITIEWF